MSKREGYEVWDAYLDWVGCANIYKKTVPEDTDMPEIYVEFAGEDVRPEIKIYPRDGSNPSFYSRIWGDDSLEKGIEKLNELAELYKKKRMTALDIKVGDEIRVGDSFGVALVIHSDMITYLDRDEKTIKHAYKKDWVIAKTGRTFLEGFMEEGDESQF